MKLPVRTFCRTASCVAFGWFLGNIITGKPLELRYAIVGALVTAVILILLFVYHIIETER